MAHAVVGRHRPPRALRRAASFAVVCGALIGGLVWLSPLIGLGEKEDFVLFQVAGLPRRTVALAAACLCAAGAGIGLLPLAVSLLHNAARKATAAAASVRRQDIRARAVRHWSQAWRTGGQVAWHLVRATWRKCWRIVYAVSVLAVILVGAEFFQRAIEPEPNSYFMFPPNTERTYHIRSDILPGVAPVARFVVNGYGLRGVPPRGEPVRMMVLGGSTVESFVQDEPNTWAAQLGHLIDGWLGPSKVWVGNGGRSGLTSFENILQMRHLSAIVPGVRSVVILIGGNDMAYGYVNANRPEPEIVPEAVRYERTFFTIQSPADGFPYDLALYRLYLSVVRLSNLARRGFMQVGGSDTAYMDWLVTTRAERSAARPFRDDLPNLAPYLAVYRNNLDAIVDLARKDGVDLTFVTQPLMYRANQTAEQESIYGWFGKVSGDEHQPAFYYSSAALDAMMKLYNQVTLDTCDRQHVLCIDAAAEIPPTSEFYYDGMHFTDAGNRLLAQIVFNGLKKGGRLIAPR